MEVTIGVALMAGLVSFVSPCFLPIVPIFLAQMVGTTGVAVSNGLPIRDYRRTAVLHSLCFVGGFSVVFILAFASVGFLGQVFAQYSTALRIIGGTILVIMGLNLAGVVQLDVIADALRPSRLHAVKDRATPLGSLLLGVSFALGWTPCIGPILGAIIAMATQAGTFGQGLMLMIVYSIGMGAPIVFLAFGAEWVTTRSRALVKYHRIFAVVGGTLLVIVGVLIMTDLYSHLSSWITEIGR